MSKQIIDGYNILGSYQTVAWYKTKEEADDMCKKMNYRGGTFYKVVPTYSKQVKFVELSEKNL